MNSSSQKGMQVLYIFLIPLIGKKKSKLEEQAQQLYINTKPFKSSSWPKKYHQMCCRSLID